MEPDPDRDLIQALQSDDAAARHDALGALYDRHQRRVLNVALRVLGDFGAAQDVAQEVFVNLERSVRRFANHSLLNWFWPRVYASIAERPDAR